MAKGTHGELLVSYDRENQIVRLRGSGQWTVDMLRQHQVEIQEALDVARRDRSDLLVFSDISGALVQTQAVTEEIAAYNPIAFGLTDRVAMVVSSSLVKMQMRRITLQPNWSFFMSTDAALRWLLAHEHTPSSGSASASDRVFDSALVVATYAANQNAAVRL